MRYTKRELLELLKDEDDDCVIVLQENEKELLISEVEFCSDDIIYINLKER